MMSRAGPHLSFRCGEKRILHSSERHFKDAIYCLWRVCHLTLRSQIHRTIITVSPILQVLRLNRLWLAGGRWYAVQHKTLCRAEDGCYWERGEKSATDGIAALWSLLWGRGHGGNWGNTAHFSVIGMLHPFASALGEAGAFVALWHLRIKT